MKVRNASIRVCLLSCICTSASFTGASGTNSTAQAENQVRSTATSVEVFDAFHIMVGQGELPSQHHLSPLPEGPAAFPSELRSIDGSGSKEVNPARGAAETPRLRNTANGYGDGVGSPGGASEKGAREISNLVNAQSAPRLLGKNVSDFLWQWGQFLDHDMNLTPIGNPIEQFNIPVPTGDPVFDPTGRGNQILPFQRSLFVLDGNGVRQQVNTNTTFIDASQVYGSDDARAQELRTLDGTG